MAAENLNTPNCIRTISGIYINVFEPTTDMIDIVDIAHALSHQCRFGGHLPKFYSVAQHSVLCSKIADPEHKLAALLHDASEAYILDIPTPIKGRLSNYKDIEAVLMERVSEKYGFEFPLSPRVKDADGFMLVWEWERLMLGNEFHEEIECWSPEQAKAYFLEEYYQLKTSKNIEHARF